MGYTINVISNLTDRSFVEYLRTLAAGLVTLGLSVVFAGTAHASEDLWSIYNKAINNDPVYKRQQFTYEADKEAINQAVSQLRPQIDAGLGTGRINDDVDAELDVASIDETYDNSNASITLSQTIWNKTRLENLALAKNQVFLSRLRLDDAYQDLLIRIAESYFNLLAAQDTLTVTQRESETLKAQLEQARELLEVGLGTSTDLFQSESRFRLAEVDILSAENAIADNRQALREITGEPVQALAKPGPDFPIVDPDPPILEEWLETAYKNNYELASAHQETDIARQNIEVARSVHWPSLDLNAGHTYDDNDGGIRGEVDSTQTTITLDLSANIYQGGQIKSQTREATQRYTASLQNADTVKRNIERRVRDAFNTVMTSKNQVIALQSAVKAAESALQARQISFESGLSTNIEVLDATRDLFSSQRDLLQSRYNYILSMFTLKSLAGILGETDFKRTSSLLQN